MQGLGGPAGPAGPTGAAGAGGSGGGGSLDFGNGQVTVGACSDSATVGLRALYTGDDFVFDTITVSDLKSDCVGQTLNFYFKIKPSPEALSQSTNYANGNLIKCTFGEAIPAAGGAARIPQFPIPRTTTCSNETQSTSLTLGEISTSDYTGKIGFEITRP